MSYKKTSIIFIMIILAFSGCTDENITNTYLDTSSSIIGRITPAEVNTEVSIWQVEQIAITYTDSLGYFELKNINSGLFELRIKPTTGLMIITDVEVKKNETTSLGEIQFNNLHWPFLESYPIHNDNSISLSPYKHIYFKTLVPLDMNSLNDGIIITPPIIGTWQKLTDTYNLYRYYSQSQFSPNTEYSITISPSLLLESGESWDDSLQISFKTENFKKTNTSYEYSMLAVPPFVKDDKFISITYNLRLNNSVVQPAISINPPVEFDIELTNYSYSSVLSINYLESFTPNETYTLTISKDLESESGTTIGVDEVIEFTVAPLQVTSHGFPPSRNIYPNLLTSDPDDYLNLRINLNADIDINALNQSITLSPPINGQWHILEQAKYLFLPDTLTYLIPDQTYSINIDGSVALINGQGFGIDINLDCDVNPFIVGKIIPEMGSTVSTNSWMSVSFNSQLNQVVTESAIQIKELNGADVPGSFLLLSGKTGISFIPSSPLISGSYYEIIVDTTVENVSGYKIKEPGYSLFKVQ